MIYTKLTKKAMSFAYNAHQNQTGKDNVPYIFHPITVAEAMKDEISFCVAILHDVVEDTEYTFEDLKKEDFPEKVLLALKFLTHNPEDSYEAYVERISYCPLASAVKRADLAHNMDISRLDNPTETDFKRIERYKKALDILDSREWISFGALATQNVTGDSLFFTTESSDLYCLGDRNFKAEEKVLPMPEEIALFWQK